jgi:PTH1 family peptidyl-tRNA hydrolase
MPDLKLIVGLGNPGRQYAAHRHNIGFQCVDLLARRHAIAVDRPQSGAFTGQGWPACAGERRKVLLVKPQTYMNLSGRAVGQLLRFYRVEPADLLVIHDDLDLDPGRIRLRPGGSSGGQNGVKSIIEHLGTQEFGRLRVGVGRPPGRMDPAAYVLQPFSAAEEEEMGVVRERAADAAEAWLFEGMTAAMNRFNAPN